MRNALIAALLVCSSAVPARAADPVAVELASATATQAGGEVSDMKYSEKADDAAISGKDFADGVVTCNGQVGMGKGSAWAGIGLTVNVNPEAKPLDASGFKSVTFRLAGAPAGSLRLRLVGPDEKIRNAGCYPVFVQAVGKDVKEFTIPLSRFSPEGWCGANARDVKKTLPELIGFEVADTNLRKAPVSFSVGTITLNP